jgi:hypothetical protein
MKSQIFIQKFYCFISSRLLCFASFLIIFYLFQTSCKTESKNDKGIIDIQLVASEPEISTFGHKNFDVEVFKMILSPPDSTLGSQIYSVQYYFNLKDTLIGRKAWLLREDDFDKTSYNWLNDSAVAITLFNSNTKAKSDTLKLFGFDRGSGIRTND